MNNSSISILIPFKNTEAYLPECIESVLNQSYENWEILAVNDHSTDKSVQIMNDFAKNDGRINVMDNEGNGIIAALRTAYSRASGTFVTRMDSDDVMGKKKLEYMLKSLQEYGQGHIALGKVEYFSEEGLGGGYKRYEQWLNRLTEQGSNYTEIYKECVIPSPCWMVYKNDLDRAGAFLSNRYPEDYDLAFRFYKLGLKCLPSKDLLHYWRDYSTRTSRTSEHYAQNYFLDIKLHYFLKLDHQPQRPLVLWGAGNKGKEVAKSLLALKTDFIWVCDNSKKIDKTIYGKKMAHYSKIGQLNDPQLIITVANEEAQKFIEDYLLSMGKRLGCDYFFFC